MIVETATHFYWEGGSFGCEISGFRRHFTIPKLLQLFSVMNLIMEVSSVETTSHYFYLKNLDI